MNHVDVMCLLFSFISINYESIIFHTYNHTSCTTMLLGGILVSLRPSVHLSVPPASRVCSVAPTVLAGSISYLYILLSNFRRCVMCKVSSKISKFKFLAMSLNLQLGIWCEPLVWIIMGRREVSQNTGVLVVPVYAKCNGLFLATTLHELSSWFNGKKFTQLKCPQSPIGNILNFDEGVANYILCPKQYYMHSLFKCTVLYDTCGR